MAIEKTVRMIRYKLGPFEAKYSKSINECCQHYLDEYIMLARKWWAIPHEDRMRAEEVIKQEDIKFQEIQAAMANVFKESE